MMVENVTLDEIKEAVGILTSANALACFGGEPFMHAIDVAIHVMRRTVQVNEIGPALAREPD